MSNHFISANVVIMTRDEFKNALDNAFRSGVKRGRIEESYDRARAAEQRKPHLVSPASGT